MRQGVLILRPVTKDRSLPKEYNKTWHELTADIENAKLQLIVAKRKIRSENALINFENFLRGFVTETDTLALFFAPAYLEGKNMIADLDVIIMMALGAMSAYGGWDVKDPVSATRYWDVHAPPWWEHNKRRLK
jgi:hypothetical protein